MCPHRSSQPQDEIVRQSRVRTWVWLWVGPHDAVDTLACTDEHQSKRIREFDTDCREQGTEIGAGAPPTTNHPTITFRLAWWRDTSSVTNHQEKSSFGQLVCGATNHKGTSYALVLAYTMQQQSKRGPDCLSIMRWWGVRYGGLDPARSNVRYGWLDPARSSVRYGWLDLGRSSVRYGGLDPARSSVRYGECVRVFVAAERYTVLYSG